MSSIEAQETSQKCSNPAEEVVKELNFFPDDLDQEEDASGGEEANKEAISTGEGSFASSSLASDTPKEFNFLPSDLGEEKSAKTMSSGKAKPDLPPHKRLKPSSLSPGPEAPKEIDFLPKDVGKEKGLTFDAQVSKEGIKASRLADQPFQMWYGKYRHARKPKDEPDSSSVSAPDKFNVQSRGGKGHVRSDGSRSPSPSEYIPHSGDVGRVQGDGGGRPTGKGTIVAILDSGINAEHAAFRLNGVPSDNKIILSHSRSFVNEDISDISDRRGHGTGCAGLFCGNWDKIKTADNKMVDFQTVAPDARVMVCKVVPDGTNEANYEAVCKAIDHVIAYNRECKQAGMAKRVNVISMSFGAKAFSHNIAKKILEAMYDDIIVICAGCNEGRNGITYPARLGHVLCIGSCTPGGDRSDFSPVGRELDFLAPGQNLWAPTTEGDNNYKTFTGTSFATAVVAGIVCQILEDVRRLSTVDEPLYDYVHNVWCMREILKEMTAVSGIHCAKIGYGVLDPMLYFDQPDIDKRSKIRKILTS